MPLFPCRSMSADHPQISQMGFPNTVPVPASQYICVNGSANGLDFVPQRLWMNLSPPQSGRSVRRRPMNL